MKKVIKRETNKIAIFYDDLENKYTSVATNNWLVMDAMAVGNNKLLIDKIKVVNPEKFAEMYDIIDNEADLFSELEEDEEDKSIKFETIKRKKA